MKARRKKTQEQEQEQEEFFASIKRDYDRGAMRYARYGRGVPRKIPEGRVLAHNNVAHGYGWPSGPNGFRWWTWPKENKPPNFVRCKCGWVDLPHYAQTLHARSFKCETFEKKTRKLKTYRSRKDFRRLKRLVQQF